MAHFNPERSFVLLKLKIYQRGVLLGILITTLVLFVLWIGEIPLRANDLIIPSMAVFCFASLFLFKKFGARYVRPFEITIFVIVFVYYLVNFAYLMSGGLQVPTLDFRNFEHWIPLLYILSFLIFRSKRALLISMAYFVYILAVGVVYFLLNYTPTIDWHNVSFLVQFYASNLLYSTLLYIIALLKDNYGEAEIRSEHMTLLANMDDLTGIHNRRKINNLLDAFIESYREGGRPFSVIMLDVDGFKKINDTFGHDIGDYVLRRVAELLRANVRESDQIGRWGGDEFFIFYPDTDNEKARLLAKRLEASVQQADFAHIGHVTISLGIATSQSSDNAGTLIKRADEGLYKVKRGKLPEVE
jgi:diguanylate cyclase (GGDEF)-like protein